MAIFLLIAGLGAAIGLAFHVIVLIVASAGVLLFMFVTSMMTDVGLGTAVLDAVIGVAVLQGGFVVGTVIRTTAFGASRRGGASDAGLDPDHADFDRPLSSFDARGFVTVSQTGADGVLAESYEAEIEAEAGFSDRLNDLFRSAPGFMAVLRGPHHVVESANEAFRVLLGGRDVIGRSIREGVPELAGQGFTEKLDLAYGNGELFRDASAQISLVRAPDTAPEQRFLDFVFEPIRDRRDRTIGIFVEGHDVTNAVHAEVRVRETERLARSTIDALPEGIAVVDAEGRIIAANRMWTDAGEGILGTAEGSEFLAACRAAERGGDSDAGAIAALVEGALSGKEDDAGVEYERTTLAGPRHFAIRAARFPGDGPLRVALTVQDITERKAYESRIEYLANHDAVTGLPNRNLLADRARQVIERAGGSRSGLALLAIDLDEYEHIKDAYGHTVGDAVMAACAERIGRLARPGDTLACIGESEFVLVLGDDREPGIEAARMGRSILDELAVPFTIGEHELSLSASIGISLFPSDGDDLPALLKNAEAAIDRARSLGGGTYQFSSPEMSARANERVIIEGELGRALRRGQLELHFQPQVEMATGALIGVEALARWQHPELGWLAPSRFIPIAEKTGMIGPIGRHILLEACRQGRAWQRDGVASVPIAINITASQLRHPDFPGLVEDAIAETGIDPGAVELEITEGMMIEVSDALLARLDSLKRLGVRLSIDDFGTGYSNLVYLRTFPLDRLKIDRSFIATAATDERSRSIVRAVLGLGESFGLDVVAEGVETAEQAALLEGLGCRQAQGYLYAMPMRGDELTQWILERHTEGRRTSTPQGGQQRA